MKLKTSKHPMVNRREFLKLSGAALAGFIALPRKLYLQPLHKLDHSLIHHAYQETVNKRNVESRFLSRWTPVYPGPSDRSLY